MQRTLWRVQCLPLCIVVIGVISVRTLGQRNAMLECRYWQSKVDNTVSGPKEAPDLENEQVVLTGIECLLQFEGNKHPARFSGAVNNAVSQILPRATADVAALYYISYLFNKRWDHADGIALWAPTGELNRAEDIEKAYRSYRKWFEEVTRIGLARARELKLNPLKESDIRWY